MAGRVYLVIGDFVQGVKARGRLYRYLVSFHHFAQSASVLLLNLDERGLSRKQQWQKRPYASKYDVKEVSRVRLSR